MSEQVLLDIFNFLVAHDQYIGYFFVPFGMIYPAWRHILSDRRKDRQEDQFESQRENFMARLSVRLCEMQDRGDAAVAEKSRLAAEIAMLYKDAADFKQRTHQAEEALQRMQKEYDTALVVAQKLRKQYDALLALYKERL